MARCGIHTEKNDRLDVKQLINKSLPAGKFARNVATVAGATAFAQLIVILALPLLTRLYSPEEFGAAAAYFSVMALFVVISAFRYELAIPLPRGDRAAFHVLALAFTILIAVSMIAGLVWLLISNWVDLKIGILPPATFSVLLALGVFTAGLYQTENYWLVRKSKFGDIAVTRIQQSLIGNMTQLLLGFAGLGAIGLIFGQIIGQCAGIARMAKTIFVDRRQINLRVRLRGLGWATRRYRRFPIFDSWAGLLNVAGAQSPVLLFAALFSPTLAGYYALAYRVFSAPIGLIGRSVSQPLLIRIVEGRRDGTAAVFMKRLVGVLATLALPPFGMAVALSSDLVPLLFGREWTPAAIVFAWTAAWVGWQFICSPLSVVLIALEAQRLNATLQLALLVIRIVPLIFLAAIGSSSGALAAFSIASIAGYAVYTAMMCREVGIPLFEVLGAIYQPVLLFSLGIIAAFLPDQMLIAKGAVIGISGVAWLFLAAGTAGFSLGMLSSSGRDFLRRLRSR